MYQKFEFLITNSKTSGSYSKTAASNPKEIRSFEALLDSLGGVTKQLSMNDGFIYRSFRPEDYQINSIIAQSKDKKIMYNSFDSNVYFERPYDEKTMIVISRKIDKNYKRDFHVFSVNWNDSSTAIIVDNQEIVTDKTIREQLESDPANALRDFGINWFYKKDYFNAINTLEKSIDLDEKNHFITYDKLFLSYDAIGFTSRGIEVLEKAIKVGHLDSGIVVNLGLAYENIGEYLKAGQTYYLDNKNSGSLRGFIRHIHILNGFSKFKEAELVFRVGNSKYPNSPVLYNDYGLSLMNSGDTASARQYFMKALELDENAEFAKKNIELLNQPS